MLSDVFVVEVNTLASVYQKWMGSTIDFRGGDAR